MRETAMRLLFAVSALVVADAAAAQDAAAAPPQQTVSLRVLDLDGRPIAGVGVAVGAGEGAAGEATTDQALQRPLAKSDRDGNLSFSVAVPREPFTPARFVLAAKGYASVAASWERPGQMAAAARPSVIHLYPGVTLRGRVRDDEGAPLAGARVELRGSHGLARVSGVSAAISSVATTDADGIYALAGAPTGPCRLTVSKPGYYAEQLFPVWADTPASPVLHRSGYVSGKLVDFDPRECHLVLQSLDPGAAHLPTPAVGTDGSFRFPLANRGPVHLLVYDERGFALADTGLQGPTAGIELRPSTHPLRIAVTCGGKPVPKFTVQPFWGTRLDIQMDWNVQFPVRPQGKDGVDGAAVVAMPDSAANGLLQVQADGCAIARIDVPQAYVPEVTCELRAGASLTGIVTDEQHAAVAGARVFAHGIPTRPNVSGNYGMPPHPALTGADGRFRIDHLPAGSFFLVVDHPDFDVPDPQQCTVALGEQAVAAPVALRRLGEIRGQLHGSLPAGALIAIGTANPFAHQRGGLEYASRRSPAAAEIAGDGRFVLHGLQHEPQALVLRLPPSHPAGGWIELPLGSFSPSATEQVIEVRDAEPATLRGAIQGDFEDTVRSWRVVALRKAASAPFALPCAYADIDSDGHYAMRLAPGDYRIGVVDLRSSVVLHRDEAELKLSAGQQLVADLAPELHRIDIDLQLPAGEDAVSGSLQLKQSESGQHRMNDFLMLRADQYQGLPLVPGQSRLRFYLPAANFTVSVHAYSPAPRADGSCAARCAEAGFGGPSAMTLPLPLTEPTGAK